MKEQLILVGISILLICIVLSGCSENIDSRFVGTWECSTEITFSGITEFINSTMVLFSDGTCIGSPPYSILEKTWEVKENRLVFNTELGLDSYTYKFSNNDNILTLYGEGSGLFVDGNEITICIKQ